VTRELAIDSSTVVKILIDISPEYYDRLLSELTEESRIYAILKNGVVIHQFERGTQFRTVEILCEKYHARMILTIAEVFCPEAAAEIEEAIRLSRMLH
jgi:NAD-specific glutamate dehydrogenase